MWKLKSNNDTTRGARQTFSTFLFTEGCKIWPYSRAGGLSCDQQPSREPWSSGCGGIRHTCTQKIKQKRFAVCFQRSVFSDWTLICGSNRCLPRIFSIQCHFSALWLFFFFLLIFDYGENWRYVAGAGLYGGVLISPSAVVSLLWARSTFAKFWGRSIQQLFVVLI